MKLIFAVLCVTNDRPYTLLQNCSFYDSSLLLVAPASYINIKAFTTMLCRFSTRGNICEVDICRD